VISIIFFNCFFSSSKTSNGWNVINKNDSYIQSINIVINIFYTLVDDDEKASREGAKICQSFLEKYPYVRIVQTDCPNLWTEAIAAHSEVSRSQE